MKLLLNASAGVLALAMSASANAQLIFSIDDLNDGAAATIVADGGPGDNFAGVEGFLDFNGAVGSWIFNDVTAFGSPVIGGPNEDIVHLDSVNVSSDNGGLLTLMLTQTDLTKSVAPFMASFGGSTSGSISYQLFVDSTNAAFGNEFMLYDSSIDMSGAFANNFAGDFTLPGMYSMTMVVTINHTGRSVTSFNYEVAIPEPTSLALLGGGLILIGFAGRIREKA